MEKELKEKFLKELAVLQSQNRTSVKPQRGFGDMLEYEVLEIIKATDNVVCRHYKDQLRNLAYIAKSFIDLLGKLTDQKLIDICSEELVISECLVERLNALEFAIKSAEAVADDQTR